MAQDRSENGSFGAGDTYSQGSFIEPWETTDLATLMTEREHSLAASMGDNEFVIMLIIHDCLRILKVLSRSSPLEPVYLGMDNLYIMNGRVRLCDPFLNRTRLWQEN